MTSDVFFSTLVNSSPSSDLLGYAHLAKAVADSIAKSKSLTGFVIAIDGKWGSGKTTTLSFIESFINEHTETHVIVHFNPWWFSSQEDLIVSLIHTLVNQLEASLTVLRPSDLPLIAETKKKLWDLADLSRAVPIDYNFSKTGFSLITGKAVLPDGDSDKPLTVPQLKEHIGGLLKSLEVKIVVIVDDIDRLTSKEIRTCLHAIKMVADLPNVTYLVALDTTVVTEALSKSFSNNSLLYLEKIFHASFSLPLPSPDGLTQMFEDGLKAIIERESITGFEQHRFNELNHFYLTKILTTPRKIYRVLNSLTVVIPALKNEVNLADLIALDCIRLSYPDLYALIKESQPFFAGSYRRTNITEKTFHDSWSSTVRQRNEIWLMELIADLFPRVTAALADREQADDFTKFARQMRICTDEYFFKFFSYGGPGPYVSEKVKSEFLSLGSVLSMNEFLNRYLVADQKNQRTSFLHLLEGLLNIRVDKKKAQLLIESLSSVCAIFNNSEKNQQFGLETKSQYAFESIVFNLLQSFDSTEKTNILTTVFQTPFPASGCYRLLQRLQRHAVMTDNNEWRINGLKMVEFAFLTGFVRMIRQFEITDPDTLVLALYAAREFHPERLQEVVDLCKISQAGLCAIMLYGATYIVSSSTEIVHRYEINLQEIASIISIDSLEKLLDELSITINANDKIQEIYSAYQFARTRGKRFDLPD